MRRVYLPSSSVRWLQRISGQVKDHPRRTRPGRFATRRPSFRLVFLFLLYSAAHAPVGAETFKSANMRDFDTRGAAKLAEEASRLRAQWTKDSVQAAADTFMEARSAFRAAGQTGGAIDALNGAAEAHFALGEYRQALRLSMAAADESRRAADRRSEHEALSFAGRVLSYLGENVRAQKFLEAVLDYCQQHGHAGGTPRDKGMLAEALYNMGVVYYTKGTALRALDYFRRSLALWAEVGDRRGVALARLNIGYALTTSGEQEIADEQYTSALALARAVGDRTVEALSLCGAGIVLSFEGQAQAAHALHLEALGIARAAGDRQSEAVALSGLAQAYEGMGKMDVALDHFAQSLRLYLKNESLDFAAGTECNVARLHGQTGDHRQALKHYRRCVALSRRANKKRIEAYALTDMAALYLTRGIRAETLSQYNKALELYRQIGDRRGQALVLNHLGDLASESGDKRKALSLYERALPLAEATGDREAEATTLYNAALAARAAGALEQALGYAEQSLQLVETLRTYVTGPDLRSSYFASVHKHHNLYVDLLMRLDRQRPEGQYAAAALLASDQARARSLLEVLAEAGEDIRCGADPKLLEREGALQQALRVKAQHRMLLSSDAETEAEAAEAARALRQLTAEYQVVQAQVREQNPRYAALTQPWPVKLEEIQAELRDENTVLLEYALGEEKSYLWMVTASSLDGYELPGRAELEARAREVYGLITARQSADGKIDAVYQARVAAADEVYEEKALALSRMMLGPVASRLGDQRLLIVAEGILQYIPFEALPVPDAGGADSAERPPMNARHEVASIPSMSALIRLRRERSGAGPAPDLVAVLADPVYEAHDLRVAKAGLLTASATPREGEEAAPVLRALKEFDGFGGAADIPRLRHTAGEAEAIMALAPSGRAMLATGFEASREMAMSSRLGRYQIVHFATHGLVSSEHPELSGIILSLVNKEGGREDGFLQLHDIYNLNLPAELVVLSACNTGLGEDVKGEGLVGLTRVFLHAGSKGVVASLWKVDDAATAELMRHFYKAMLEDGLPPAAALRLAREELRRQKRWRAPYYWAGFVMQGEYRQRIKTGGGRVASSPFIPAVVVFSCVGLYLIARLRGRSATGVGDTATPETLTSATSPRPTECPDDRL